jgi:uncharacterized membrane protein HdeD (DUF308 family)
MAGSEPAPRSRPSLGKAVGQGWALWLAGFLALAGGVSLLVNPDADLRLVRWLVGLFLAGWGVLRLVHVARASRRDRTWLILSGLAALVAGIVVLAWSAVTVTALVYILVVGGPETPDGGCTCYGVSGPSCWSACCWCGRTRP